MCMCACEHTISFIKLDDDTYKCDIFLCKIPEGHLFHEDKHIKPEVISFTYDICNFPSAATSVVIVVIYFALS